MENGLMIFMILVMIGVVITIFYRIYITIKIHNHFKYCNNPYRRICTKCGAYHEVMESMVDGKSWWEETREGTDHSCTCKSYAEYRDY